MLTEPDGPFIDISKLDLAKYAAKPDLAKVIYLVLRTVLWTVSHIYIGDSGVLGYSVLCL